MAFLGALLHDTLHLVLGCYCLPPVNTHQPSSMQTANRCRSYFPICCSSSCHHSPKDRADRVKSSHWSTVSARRCRSESGHSEGDYCLFRQNTYLQNKKHMLTCQVGLVVIDLITSPVVSWRGCETPPQYRGSAVILCSTTVVRGPLSSWWPAVVVC